MSIIPAIPTLNPPRALPSLNFVAVKLGAYSPDQHIVKHVIQARTSKFLPRSTFNCIPSTVTRFILVCRVPCDEPSAAGFVMSPTGIMSRRHWKGEPLTANTRGMAIAMPPRTRGLCHYAGIHRSCDLLLMSKGTRALLVHANPRNTTSRLKREASRNAHGAAGKFGCHLGPSCMRQDGRRRALARRGQVHVGESGNEAIGIGIGTGARYGIMNSSLGPHGWTSRAY
ncbi:hypothetical protein X797_010986 [Metarhizium robertsii]|uniref:Uncharacterized protein n=1 Tax=Metarhizium robertsii TaxID=568076 RepID=A0A014QSW9_9HYPO|nr:hypothetical protein X797_010986 [Metarhizium robertsii]